jgi:hypothetical protein
MPINFHITMLKVRGLFSEENDGEVIKLKKALPQYNLTMHNEMGSKQTGKTNTMNENKKGGTGKGGQKRKKPEGGKDKNSPDKTKKKV